MPPKCKFTRNEIIAAALSMTRESGIRAVTARALGARLGASSNVIFSLFDSMDEVQTEVINAANALYQSYIEQGFDDKTHPPYMSSGLSYIRFAKEQKELFKLLFMRDRAGETISDGMDEIAPLLQLIRKNTGMSEQDAYVFHMEMWVCVHGIATMIATGYLEWDRDMIEKILSDSYLGILTRYKTAGKIRE